MPKLLVLTILLSVLLPPLGEARTYYFSSSQGQDQNDGTSETTPWQTLDPLNTRKLPDNSTLLFKRQDTFRGTVHPVKFPSGTTLGAYGQGDNPILSGSLLITDWKPTTHPALAPQVYEAKLAPLTEPLQHLFVNGQLMTIARYPNVPNPAAKNWLKVGATAGQEAFTDPALAAYPKPQGYWQGATLRIRSYSWMYKILPVTGYDARSGKITAKGLDNQLPQWGYFLDGKLEELDTPGEWFYDEASHQVYLYPPTGLNPNQARIEGAIQNVGLYIGKNVNEVTIENLTFQHFITAIQVGAAQNITIRHCRFEHNGLGISSGQTNPLMISDNHFDHQLKSGISLSGEVNSEVQRIVQNNWITHNATYPLYGQRTQGTYLGVGIIASSRGNTIRQNTIDYSSYAGINLEGSGGNLVEQNVVRHSLQLLNDGGGIMLSSSGNRLRGNIVLDSLGNTDESNGCGNAAGGETCSRHPSYGMGIGSNSGFKENVIEGNTVANHLHYGIRLNGTHHTQVRQNLVYNNRTQITVGEGEGPPGSSFENVVEGNIIYALAPEQEGLHLQAKQDSARHGTFEQNYYCNPYRGVVVTQNGRAYSLAHWQQTSGQDAHSRGCPWQFRLYRGLSPGENLIKNSTFDTASAPWVGGSYEATQAQLEGGSLKLVFPENKKIGVLIHTGLPLQEKQWYRMRLSVVGSGFGNLEWSMNDVSDPKKVLQLKWFLPYDGGRKDYEEFFQFPRTVSQAQLYLLVRPYDASPFWLDNVFLEPVEVIKEDATKQSVLFTNPSNHPTSFDLGTTKYLDLDENEVTAHVTLPPFSSRILIASGTTPHSPVTLTISKLGSGSGTVNSSVGLGKGIHCGETCTERFTDGSLVNLTIAPDAGSIFSGWSEDHCGESLTMTKNTTCTANFSLVPTLVPTVTRTLKILKGGISHGGMVRSNISTTMNCGSTCTFNYPEGSVVTLTALPAEGYKFIGWGGECRGTENLFTVTLDTDKTCIARFDSQ